jgi:hypothetical protein
MLAKYHARVNACRGPTRMDDSTATAEAGTNETDVEFAIEAHIRAITGQ